MKIIDLIRHLTADTADRWNDHPIDPSTTRDQILYGDPTQKCTGIVTTCYASVEVIRRAGEQGFNFLIVHEALFWNHGDRTDWLGDNTAFLLKKALLDHYHICVWRMHDHIHAGLRTDYGYRDGIFGGLSAMLGWEPYELAPHARMPQDFLLPETSVDQMARNLNNKFHLKGLRFIGNPDCRIRRIHLPMHILGHSSDNDLIARINQEDIHCLLTLELVDFTVCEYIRDAAMLGENRCIFALGHFNLEEIGMEFYAGYLRRQLDEAIPVAFLQSGDAYSYIPT